MAKDMYQKRRERKEKAMSNDSTQQGFKKTEEVIIMAKDMYQKRKQRKFVKVTCL